MQGATSAAAMAATNAEVEGDASTPSFPLPDQDDEEEGEIGDTFDELLEEEGVGGSRSSPWLIEGGALWAFKNPTNDICTMLIFLG